MNATPAIRWVWHYAWAALVVGALLLNAFLPVVPGFSVWAFSLLPYPVAAAVILANRPGNGVGRMLAVSAVAAGAVFIGTWASWTWVDARWSVYLEAALSPAIPVLFWGALGLLYVFPSGRIHHAFARSVFLVFTTVIVGLAVAAVFAPGPLAVTGRPNPLSGPPWVGTLFDNGIAVMAPALVVGVVSAVARYRRSGPVERAQLKWFVGGIAAVIGLVVVVAVVPEDLPPPWEEVTTAVVVVGFWALPAAIVVAVTRHRLYEIDRFISRVVTYLVVVATLAGGFAGMVIGLQAVLPASSSETVVAATTLAMVALFDPLRRSARRAVDRRFNRTRYEAERVISQIVAHLRDSVDLAEIVDRTEQTLLEVFEPQMLSVWLEPGTAS